MAQRKGQKLIPAMTEDIVDNVEDNSEDEEGEVSDAETIPAEDSRGFLDNDDERPPILEKMEQLFRGTSHTTVTTAASVDTGGGSHSGVVFVVCSFNFS